MRYRALGHSDLRVSEIALGSWLTLGTHVERDAALASLDRALGAGVDFVDTANVYGFGAAELGPSMAQLALAWGLRMPNVRAAIVGASRPSPVDDDVAASGVELPPEVVARIDAIARPVAHGG